MQKVYRLLRNNQQTGPYSLDDIVQLGLKPFDLIWVEGKSGGWSYPSEIDTLKNYVPAAPTNLKRTEDNYFPALDIPLKKDQPRNVFVKMPASVQKNNNISELQERPISIEEKAEALRRRAQEYLAQPNTQPESITTNYNRSINEIEEEYTSWVYKTKTKTKKISAKQTATIVLAIGILVLSAFGINALIFKKDNGLKNKLTSVNIRDTQQPQNTYINEQESKQVPLDDENVTSVTSLSKKEKIAGKFKVVEKSKEELNNPADKSGAVNDQSVIDEPIENNTPQNEEDAVVTEPDKEKKKTFKETINDLFKKKKKDEPAANEGVANKNGERNARKRDEEKADNEQVATPELVDITNGVEARFNNPDNWMMGIKGLKVTLYNKSNAVLKTALVEVSYYSEQNSLIEKRTIQFSDISAGKSKTIAAPDHRMADHADVKVVWAKGTEVAYAKN